MIGAPFTSPVGPGRRKSCNRANRVNKASYGSASSTGVTWVVLLRGKQVE